MQYDTFSQQIIERVVEVPPHAEIEHIERLEAEVSHLRRENERLGFELTAKPHSTHEVMSNIEVQLGDARTQNDFLKCEAQTMKREIDRLNFLSDRTTGRGG